MTVDAAEPAGTRLTFSLDNYIRENREQINLLWSAVGACGAIGTIRELTLSLGQALLVNDTDLTDAPLETVLITANGAGNSITQITGCTQGQIKIFIAQDDDLLTWVYDAGKLSLNSGGTNLLCQTYDVLALVNVGGNPGTSNGWWLELFRNLRA